jgi:predicted RNase H-like HicB family nuclease
MTTYHVTARRSGDWWALEVPELPGVHSQTKRLDHADEAAREAIAVMLDIEPEDIQVTIGAELDQEIEEAVREATRARKEAEAAAAYERDAMRRAAYVITTKKKMSQRDAGAIMGVSFQRISQLLKPTVRRATKQRAATQSKSYEPTPHEGALPGYAKRPLKPASPRRKVS